MAKQFDVAVVGRGLWGTAAAMHLAKSGADVALIGPAEPIDKSISQGPFASHYDAGRITRSVATHASWSRLSQRSISRYRDLEAASGIPFYTACGGVMASPDAAYSDRFLKVASGEKLPHEMLAAEKLANRLPMFAFPSGTRAVFDATGGVIDPRAMRQAHEACALHAGAEVIDDAATSLGDGRVHTDKKGAISARQVLVATGSYAALDNLLPQRPVMTVCARTVYFAEVTEAEAERLANMPSLIYQEADRDFYIYLLPPIRYPDGRLLIKIGGENVDNTVRSSAEARDWMQSSGSVRVAQHLANVLRSLMPDLRIERSTQEACILALTPSDQPYLERLNSRLTIATGCCGAGAKCADEIGRIAAEITLGQSIDPRQYSADFMAALG